MMNGQPNGLGLFNGLRAFVGGIGFIVGTPSVWGYALVPVAMVLFLTAGFGILGIWGASHVGDAVFGSYGTWGHLGNWALTIILALAAVLFAILLAICLAQPFSGFALEAIVSARENALTGWTNPRPGVLESTFRSLKIAVFTLSVAVPVFGALFLINFVFPAALVITLPLKFLLYAWLLAWNFLDYPLGIHRFGLRARWRWVMRHFDAFCGFGLSWAVLGLIPGIILVLLPMGVAGAAELVVEAEQTANDEGERRLDFAD